MELFVDESGNLGKKDRYFVIAFVLSVNKKRIKNFVKRFCAKNDYDEVKASKLSFPEKQKLIMKLFKIKDNKISYITVDKYKISSQRLWNDKNILFNYLFKFLIKDIVSNTKEDINIHVDEHTIKVSSINSLQDYLRIQAYTEWGFSYNLNIIFTDSKNSKLIQVADLAANIIYARYNYNRSHLYNLLNISESIKFPYKKFGC